MLTYSIITANYNSGTKLLTTVESVLSQDAKLELIIVDGGSTDESYALGHSYALVHNPRIRWQSEPDRGVYDAMNKGVRQAQGRYLLFLGAGDSLEPRVLSLVEKTLPLHDCALVYGDAYWNEDRYAGEFTWTKLFFYNICQQAIFYGRDIFQMCGEFDLKYKAHADWEMNLRCFGCRHIAKKYLDLVIARFELGGISGRGDPEFERDKRWLVRRHLGLLPYCRIKWWDLKNKIRSG